MENLNENFLDFQYYAISEVSLPEINGNLNSEIVVIVDENDFDETLKAFLTKILGAIKIDFNEVHLILSTAEKQIPLASLVKKLRSKKVISFGKTTSDLQLNIEEKLNGIAKFEDYSFILASPLREISTSQTLKKELWASLQAWGR